MDLDPGELGCLNAQLTPSSGARVVASTAYLCTGAQQKQVSTFFTAHPVNSAERVLPRSVSSIDACVRLRTAQGPSLLQWLAQHGD